MASSNGHTKVVELLLAAGAQVGPDSVARAALNNHDDVLTLLETHTGGILGSIHYWVTRSVIFVFGTFMRSAKEANSQRKEKFATQDEKTCTTPG